MSQYYPASFETTAQRPASGRDRVIAALCHVSLLFSLPIVVPVLVLILNPLALGGSPYLRRQAIQALLFHLLVVVASGLCGVLAGAFYFHGLLFLINLLTWPIALVFGLGSIAVLVWGVIVEIVAAIKALQGRAYRLPIVGRF